VIASIILKNGGVVFELNSEEAADWVKSGDNKEAFTQAFGGAAELKDRATAIKILYLPVSLRETLTGLKHSVESENALPAGTITRLRWLRNPD
ncbi:hypothetical protein BDZ97DRAFT_1643949, partial [Flammula alnicola]